MLDAHTACWHSLQHSDSLGKGGGRNDTSQNREPLLDRAMYDVALVLHRGYGCMSA